MKERNGFVSNSSSSSFVVMKAGDKTIIEDGSSEDMEVCGSFSIEIDKLIADLEEAKKNGAKTVHIEHGGGYNG